MPAWDEIARDVLEKTQGVFATSRTIVLRPGENDEETVRGVFRSAHMQMDPSTGTAVSTSEPILSLSVFDVKGPELKQGTRVRVGEDLYRMRDIEPDGEGGLRIPLKRAVT